MFNSTINRFTEYAVMEDLATGNYYYIEDNFTVIDDNMTSSNMTMTSIEPWTLHLAKAYGIFNTFLLVLLMLSMGCSMTQNEIWTHLKRPFNIAIGAVSQFVVMPLVVFGALHAIQPEKLEAIAFMIIGTCPGGAMSNLFTYWNDGDVSLRFRLSLYQRFIRISWLIFRRFTRSRTDCWDS